MISLGTRAALVGEPVGEPIAHRYRQIRADTSHQPFIEESVIEDSARFAMSLGRAGTGADSRSNRTFSRERGIFFRVRSEAAEKESD